MSMKTGLWLSVLTVALSFAGAAEAAKQKSVVRMSGTLNLNQASEAQLDELPGIGQKAARSIIAYREKTPFKRIEDLVKVKGFGKKRFEKLKPHLTVTGPTNLTVQREKLTAQGRAGPPGR